MAPTWDVPVLFSIVLETKRSRLKSFVFYLSFGEATSPRPCTLVPGKNEFLTRDITIYADVDRCCAECTSTYNHWRSTGPMRLFSVQQRKNIGRISVGRLVRLFQKHRPRKRCIHDNSYLRPITVDTGNVLHCLNLMLLPGPVKTQAS